MIQVITIQFCEKGWVLAFAITLDDRIYACAHRLPYTGGANSCLSRQPPKR